MSTSVKLLVSTLLAVLAMFAYVGPGNALDAIANARASLAFTWPEWSQDSATVTEQSFGGCMDLMARNYDALATIEDGSCVYEEYGCTDSFATNYRLEATVDDGSCDYAYVYGCTDPSATNFDAWATIDDGSCAYEVYGCMDVIATNHDPLATIDDGTCTYEYQPRCETREADLGASGATFDPEPSAVSSVLEAAFRGLTGVDPSGSQVDLMSSDAARELRSLANGSLKVGLTFCLDFDGNWKLQVVTPISAY